MNGTNAHHDDHAPPSDSRAAALAARAVLDGFIAYREAFDVITSRAKDRFERRDWPAARSDAVERIDLYGKTIDDVEHEVRTRLGDRVTERRLWTGVKAAFSGAIDRRDDWELGETFYNSVTRRIFDTVGVDQEIEFVDTDFVSPPVPASEPAFATYRNDAGMAALLRAVLADYPFRVRYENAGRDADHVAAIIGEQLGDATVERVEMVRSVFYRGKGAYLVGRIVGPDPARPLVLALRNTPNGLVIDAVLLEEDDVSILFSFARSAFHLVTPRPFDVVRFLGKVLPRKRVSELYIALGFTKHGKTELYRELRRHLAVTEEQFAVAPGVPGLVMIAFTMPGYDLVFKVIRDRFGPGKQLTRQTVHDKYRLVFRHDRAGRLVDAQEFEHLLLPLERFSPELVEELTGDASQTVHINDGRLFVDHAYVERRVTPLDIHLRVADRSAVRAAVVDYGRAVKDLAQVNIFPGDLLIKNFGVTRHGRVVFYDYDELALLTDVRFRKMPEPSTEDEILAAEPWFGVDDRDVFPEELRNFLGLRPELRELFEAEHSDLFDTRFWHAVQERLQQGKVVEITPYRAERRLPGRIGAGLQSD